MVIIPTGINTCRNYSISESRRNVLIINCLLKSVRRIIYMGKVENKSSKPSFATRKIIVITLVITIMLSFVAISPSKVSAYQYPYQDPGLTVDQRIADLLPSMTIDEKIGQML